MVVNVYYKNGNFYNTYENIERVKSYPRYHILSQSSGKSPIIEDVMTFSTSDFMLEFENSCCEMSESKKMQGVTLNDIKRLMFSEMKVFIFGVDESNGNSTLHIYSGLFKDVPLNVMNLPVNWVYPSTTDTFDISVDILSLNEDLIIKKEGVEQYAENNSNN